MLDRVTGQERAKAQIRAWLASGRLPHAILITGREGAGKRRLAIELARALLCGRSGTDGGCGDCPACLQVDRLTHPNLHVLLPMPPPKRKQDEDEQFAEIPAAALDYLQGGRALRTGGNIRKRHLVRVHREMAFAPAAGGSRRVALVFEADRMRPEGSNSLLKTLEEPSRQALFLLVSETAERLLPTVVSRCQRLALRPLTAAEVRDQLQASGAAAERAALAGRLAAGGTVRPAAVADDSFEPLRDLVERFIDSGLCGREQDYWVLLEELGGRPDKERMEGFLELCSTYLRDVLLLQGDRGGTVAHGDRAGRLDGWSRRLCARGLDHLARTVDEAYEALGRNVSPQLLLGDLWHQLRRSGASVE